MVFYWIFVALVLGLTLFIGYGTYVTAQLLRTWTPDRNLLLLPGESLLRFALIFICVGLGFLSGLPWGQLGWQGPQWPAQILVGVFAGVLIAFGFYITTRWLIARTGERFYSSVLIRYIVPHSRRELVLVLLAFVPVILLEELLFRSLLLGGLSPLLPVPVLLGLFSVVFGLFHSPQGIWGMAGAALGGLIFGLLFLWQWSLVAPIVAHYVANAVQVVLAMGQGEDGEERLETGPGA